MRSLFSNLIMLALVFCAFYGVRQYINPYDFRGFAPAWPMTVMVGDKNYYFPLHYIEPRYSGGGYEYGQEAVVWMNLDPETLKPLPQVKGIKAGVSDRIDVALTSDNHPVTNKVTQHYKQLKNKETRFKTFKHGLKRLKEDKQVDYLGKNTHINCEAKKCLLYYHSEATGLRAIIYFDEKHLPRWQDMLDRLAKIVKTSQIQPSFMTYLKAITPKPIAEFFNGAASDMKHNLQDKS